MCTINKEFEVHAANDGLVGYTLPVTPSKPVNGNSMMCITIDNALVNTVVYITKQQAMDFFGLKDPMAVRHNLDL